MDLALNNLQRLICHKTKQTKPNQTRQVRVKQPVRTYLQQLCADTGWSLDNLLEAMDNRDKWQGRVREICAHGTT